MYIHTFSCDVISLNADYLPCQRQPLEGPWNRFEPVRPCGSTQNEQDSFEYDPEEEVNIEKEKDGDSDEVR